MKKIILTCALIGGVVFSSNAQEIAQNAIGLRFGGGNGFGTEISYQRALAENNRLELDLGFEGDDYFSAVQLVGLYQWVWNIEGGFNWYAGPGIGLGFYSFDDDLPGNNDDDPSEIYALIAGDIGIEYSFDFPLLLSLDFRPEFVLDGNDYSDDIDFGIGLGVRYQF